MQYSSLPIQLKQESHIKIYITPKAACQYYYNFYVDSFSCCFFRFFDSSSVTAKIYGLEETGLLPTTTTVSYTSSMVL